MNLNARKSQNGRNMFYLKANRIFTRGSMTKKAMKAES